MFGRWNVCGWCSRQNYHSVFWREHETVYIVKQVSDPEKRAQKAGSIREIMEKCVKTHRYGVSPAVGTFNMGMQ